MATAVGAGFDLSKLLSEFSRLDKELEKFMKKGKVFEKNWQDIFNNMGRGGLQSFASQLASVRKSVVDFGKQKVGVKWDSNSLQKYIDDVNKLILVIKAVQKEAKKENIKGVSIVGLKKELKEANELLTLVKRAEKAFNQSATNRQQTYKGSLRYSSSAKTIEQERQAIINLEAARNKLKKTDSDYANKLNTLNEAIQRHERNLKNVTKTARQQREEYEKRKKSTMDKWYSSNSERAIKFSSNAKTLEDEARAIKYLEAARAKLNTQDKNYERNLATLNSRIREHKKNLDDAKKGSQELRDKHNSLIHTGDQLKRALLGVFSVSAIKGYVSKLVEVRGEFELQHKALEVLVGDVAEANKLWEKTVQLAVKSPFAVKELVTYTKQLAAYRVESNKLYDTTKMLADISAGLGVDMNRLILAYGQVKAANYLRGTELRQFSEAGINVLQLLADRFTEIEGKAVSVGEVFDRVSKRMVSFADVQAVLESVTGAGGQFYKMQEQQAETLKFVWKNLRDSVDLMLNDIGAKNDSILKGTLSIVKSLVDNWEKVGDIIVPLFSFIVSKMAVMKAMSFLDTKPWNAAIDRMEYFSMMLTQGKKKANEFASSIVGLDATSLVKGAWGTAITAVILLVSKLAMEWVKHNAEIKAVNEEYAKLKETVSEITFGFNTAQLDSDIEKQKEKLTELISIANKEYNLNIKINVKELTNEEIDEQFKAISNRIVNASAFAQESTIALKGKWWDFLFGNRAEKDMQQYGNAFSETSAKVINISRLIANNLIKLQEEGEKLTEAQKEALNTFTTPFDPKKETEVAYINKLIKSYNKLNEEISKRAEIESSGNSSVQNIYYTRWARDLGIVPALMSNLETHKDEATRELNNWFEDISSNLTGSSDENAVYLKTAIDKQSWTSATKELAYLLANEKFGFNITPIINQPEDKTIADWQIEYNKFVETLSTGKVLKMDANTDTEQYISILKGTYENYAKEVAAWDAGNAKARAQYSEEEIESIREQNNERKKALDWLVYEEKKKSGENEALQRLKKQISLIREAARAYDEMRKLHDEAYADEHIMSEYEEAFKEAGLGNISGYAFGTREDELNNLNKLKTSAEQVAGGMLELSKATAQVGVQIDNVNQELSDKKLFDQISDIFSNYEISLEMDKLNIPSDLAQRLFGFEAIDLNDIRGKVLEKFGLGSMVGASNQGIYDSEQFKAMSKERQDELRKALEKESEIQDKALKDRMKEYVKYLREEQTERVKIKLEEVRKLKEIDEMNELTLEEKNLMKQNVKKESNAAMAKAEWESFAKSPYIIQLFDDIDTTSTKSLSNLHDKLVALKSDLYNAGLPASELKEVLDKINQVEEELNSRNPFRGWGEGLKNMFGGLRGSRNAYNEQLAKQVAADNLVKQWENDLNAFNEENGEFGGNQAERNRLNDQLRLAIEKAEQLREEGKGIEEAYHNARVSVTNFASNLQESINISQELVNSSLDLVDSFGLLSDEQRAVADNSMNILGDIGGLATSAARIASGDIIGGIASAISSTASLITNINKTGDAVKDMDIARQAKNIERLEKSYEKLEKAMDEAYSIEQLKEAQDAMRENIDGQIEALERQKAAEESKKNTDQEAVDDYADQIEELEARKAELQKELVEKMGGTYDYSSVAEQFLDAWLTAFNETGDGLSGLEKEFDSFWKDILKKQVIHGGAAAIVQNYVDEINNALKSDSEGGSRFSEKEKKAIEDAKREAMSNLNDFYDYMNEQYGLSDIEGAGLTGLQSRIQGMTEEQSDVLAAYWNAVRLDVSDIRSRLENYMDRMLGNGENPMLSSLQAIAQSASDIHSLLTNVSGASTDGDGIRVIVKNWN